ncbi:hypothetical protein C2G38_2189764 [Gigaspora rosea]|uniref:Uncharacterized protein n=1 Tax=Gigaspora rosea TaxID=44941 RepID=A0A397V596_9GLOM|nr:hypothetical protein C2G38_2189764 [Gigaspora rosea]
MRFKIQGNFVLRSKDVVTHDQWVEDDYIKERIAKGVSEGSENALVEIIARIIDMVMFNLPVDYEVDVTRSA